MGVAHKLFWAAALAMAGGPVGFATAQAQGNTTKPPIVIGQTTSLTGVAAGFAKPVADGLRATVEAANRSGGIGGRPVKLVVLDDGFDPQRAVENASRLIDEGAVALVGPNGAPSTQALTPLARERRVALIGSTQGAPALREFEPTRFYVRASFRDEVNRIVTHLRTLGMQRVAVAYFDNPFGQQGAQMVKEAVQAAGLDFVGPVAISADAAKTQAAAAALSKQAPQVVVLYSLVQPAAEFVRAYRSLGTAQFYTISVASADALHSAIGEASRGIVIAQLFPAPTQTALRLVSSCTAALSAVGIAPISYAHIEGCVIGGVTLEGLRRAKGEVNREALIDALSGATIDLGGFRTVYGPNARNGSTFVELTMANGGGKTAR
ncbi:ABC transporter substrate-binding protein [Aquabacterium sp.]|uniref:ABC transporter substrate-binding protein n=1 Tax=Aquabacterium sp. TaxID=1872578 RepID=UPI002D0B6376|nr:ABC transporter substrate-binding protein [Aquabacterium sp.]HSW05365.1 ABC transporter substrate-binding protein [Aquabacterium sp.]